MFACISAVRKSAARLFVCLSIFFVAACDPINLAGGGDSRPRIDPTAPVQVALLVPSGSGNAQDAFLAQNLENAARLAISDLNGVSINLRVYSTAGSYRCSRWRQQLRPGSQHNGFPYVRHDYRCRRIRL